MEAENINLNKIYYAVFIICVAFSIVSVSATQEMPNTKNGTSISDDKVSNNSKTIDHTLKFGDSGENVVSLQKALYSGGFYIGKIDGDFGPYTKKAVEIFQAENGLKTNGIVNEVTSSYLKKLGYLKNYNKNYDSNVVDSSKKND
ncbi:peptidoglycan-binding domain-containing protein [Methanobrevibacter arboriphilus]|uniref:peptidoglycan-binding domain-containing protein n=1 Tax=Methanobrevibacter arboriphilus TaxID=39441 RepID=UPI000A9518A7|nr:peptidoglycan-binding domain-containing protein [Methanobrevibacter arboriphilus]